MTCRRTGAGRSWPISWPTSWFEGDVPREILERWMRKAVTLLDTETDSLRVYHLCAACAPKVDVYGRGLPFDESAVRIL